MLAPPSLCVPFQFFSPLFSLSHVQVAGRKRGKSYALPSPTTTPVFPMPDHTEPFGVTIDQSTLSRILKSKERLLIATDPDCTRLRRG